MNKKRTQSVQRAISFSYKNSDLTALRQRSVAGQKHARSCWSVAAVYNHYLARVPTKLGARGVVVQSLLWHKHSADF
jgi:ATP-dependent protease Clp ATPase subunit